VETLREVDGRWRRDGEGGVRMGEIEVEGETGGGEEGRS